MQDELRIWMVRYRKIAREYNNLKHRIIGMKCVEVNKDNEKELLETVFKYIPPGFITKSTFQVIDRIWSANKKIYFLE